MLALIRQFGQPARIFFLPVYGQVPVWAGPRLGQEQSVTSCVGRPEATAIFASPGSELPGREIDGTGDGQGTKRQAFGFQGLPGFMVSDHD